MHRADPCIAGMGLFYFVTTVILSGRSCFALSGFCWEFNIIVALTFNWFCAVSIIIGYFISVSTNLKIINHLLKQRTWKWKKRYDILTFSLPLEWIFNDSLYFEIRGPKLNKIFMTYFSISPVFVYSCWINLYTLVIDLVSVGGLWELFMPSFFRKGLEMAVSRCRWTIEKVVSL